MSMDFKKITILLFVLVLVVIFGLIISRNKTEKESFDSLNQKVVEKTISKEKFMKLTSPVFGNNQKIPPKYTCDGENINPPLLISEVPEGTNSLVLIMDDPDAPAGTWLHWTVWNIKPETDQIQENNIPEGAVEGKTSFGTIGYGGPCPPSGTHRYFFKLFALDSRLNIEEGASLEELEKAIEGHILEKAELIGLYIRS